MHRMIPAEVCLPTDSSWCQYGEDKVKAKITVYDWCMITAVVVMQSNDSRGPFYAWFSVVIQISCIKSIDTTTFLFIIQLQNFACSMTAELWDMQNFVAITSFKHGIIWLMHNDVSIKLKFCMTDNRCNRWLISFPRRLDIKVKWILVGSAFEMYVCLYPQIPEISIMLKYCFDY